MINSFALCLYVTFLTNLTPISRGVCFKRLLCFVIATNGVVNSLRSCLVEYLKKRSSRRARLSLFHETAILNRVSWKNYSVVFYRLEYL
jgi:hypothetical protein